MEGNFNVRLARWVIEDGDPERHVGEVFKWVVDLRCDAPLRLSTEKAKAAVLVHANRYRINAEVIYMSRDPKYECCVLDFGITAISESGSLLRMPLPPDCEEGEYVTGEVDLGFPLCTDVQPYDINHTWRLDRITASSSSEDLSGGLEITDTGLLKAESYILNCSHVSSPPAEAGKPPIREEAQQYLEPPWEPSIWRRMAKDLSVQKQEQRAVV